MPVKAYFLTEIPKMFSRHFYEDERSILHLSPFFLHRQPDDCRKPLAGLEDNSCLKLDTGPGGNHWNAKPGAHYSCVNSLTSKSPHKVMEGYE